MFVEPILGLTIREEERKCRGLYCSFIDKMCIKYVRNSI